MIHSSYIRNIYIRFNVTHLCILLFALLYTNSFHNKTTPHQTQEKLQNLFVIICGIERFICYSRYASLWSCLPYYILYIPTSRTRTPQFIYCCRASSFRVIMMLLQQLCAHIIRIVVRSLYLQTSGQCFSFSCSLQDIILLMFHSYTFCSAYKHFLYTRAYYVSGYYFNSTGLLVCEPFYSQPSYRILATCSLYFPTTMILMYCYGSSFHASNFRLMATPPAATTPSSTSEKVSKQSCLRVFYHIVSI